MLRQATLQAAARLSSDAAVASRRATVSASAVAPLARKQTMPAELTSVAWSRKLASWHLDFAEVKSPEKGAFQMESDPGRLEELTLWTEVVGPRATDEQKVMVRAWVAAAEQISSRVIETFPTYTLHDVKHSRNVAEIMAALVAPFISKMTALEAVFLLLAAHYHDLGMVFSDDDRASFSQEPQWPRFLNDNADAYLAVRRAGATVPVDIAEWFCRWIHAERVRTWVRRLAKRDGMPALRWGVVGISLQLEDLCRSHNLPVDDLRALLPTDFLAGDADLFACGILLRLADILDFDRTRSPDAVYQYLGIDHARTRRDAASRTEWRKHLCSDGMRFPEPATRVPGYSIDFIAAPQHPAVQHDLGQFLDVIDAELQECQRHIAGASPRWRDLPLPAAVNRRNIISQGYVPGDFRFQLDQSKVVKILMGENLYSDPYTFIRELLQNALDATRARVLVGPGDATREKMIEIDEWTDREGYRWIRIDDFGLGMDLDVVKAYLLRIGQSYYSSSQFEAEAIRRAASSRNFRPISRFGIGLLSCFIAADRIEISTLRVRDEKTEGVPVRLGLERLHGFFVVQTPPHPPAPMPSARGEEDCYRREPGTSIAVRIDPQRPLPSLDLQDRLERLILCPAVPVRLNGKRIGIYENERTALSPGRHQIPLDEPIASRIRDFLPDPPDDLCSINIDIIDVGHYFPMKDIGGRVVVVKNRFSNSLERWLKEWAHLLRIGVNASLEGSDATVELRSSISINKEIIDGIRSGTVSTGALTDEEDSWIARLVAACPEEETRSFSSFGDRRMVEMFNVSLPKQTLGHISEFLDLSINPKINSDNWFVMAHAGIVLPRTVRGNFEPFLRSPFEHGSSCHFATVFLNGRIRLGLSLNREDIREVPLEFLLALEYAVRQFYEDAGDSASLKIDDIIDGAKHCEVPTVARLEAIRAFMDWSSWEKLSLFDTDKKRLSLADLLEAVDRRPVRLRLPRSHPGTLAAVRAYLLVTRFDVELDNMKSDHGMLRRRRVEPISAGEQLFPPLTFVHIPNPLVFRSGAGFVNRDHPFSIWLLENAPALQAAHAPIFDKLLSAIGCQKTADDEDSHGLMQNALETLAQRARALTPDRDLWPTATQFIDR